MRNTEVDAPKESGKMRNEEHRKWEMKKAEKVAPPSLSKLPTSARCFTYYIIHIICIIIYISISYNIYDICHIVLTAAKKDTVFGPKEPKLEKRSLMVALYRCLRFILLRI